MSIYIYIYILCIYIYIYIYCVYIYIVNILLTRIFKKCSIRKSRVYIFIYLSKIKTQRFLRYTVFHVFPQSSDVIIFYTVCYITFHGLTKVQNWDSLAVIKELLHGTLKIHHTVNLGICFSTDGGWFELALMYNGLLLGLLKGL